MTPRLTLAVLILPLVASRLPYVDAVSDSLVAGASAKAVSRIESSRPFPRFARQAVQEPRPGDFDTLVGNLASLDLYTRTNAARLLRRAPAADAVKVLTAAVRTHSDEFVRYRSLVLLTAFNDRGTRDLMVSLLRDRNDRLREVAYKWLEQNPDPELTDTLLAALQSEQAEFVRPALVGALAALDDSPQVQRALLAESMRGLDFFREAVIEALGRQRAAYAVETIAGITTLDGPLRRAAILALGRIGGTRASAVLKGLAADAGDALPIVRAAQCLSGEACDTHITALSEAAVVTGSAATVRASIDALAAVATGAGTDGAGTDGAGGGAGAARDAGAARGRGDVAGGGGVTRGRGAAGGAGIARSGGDAAGGAGVARGGGDVARDAGVPRGGADVISGLSPTQIGAAESLVALAARGGLVRDQAALAFSTVALRRADAVVSWLDAAPETVRASAIDLLKEGFERLEEDFAEEQFYAAARAAYWKGAEGSSTRALSSAIIQRLEF